MQMLVAVARLRGGHPVACRGGAFSPCGLLAVRPYRRAALSPCGLVAPAWRRLSPCRLSGSPWWASPWRTLSASRGPNGAGGCHVGQAQLRFVLLVCHFSQWVAGREPWGDIGAAGARTWGQVAWRESR